MSQSTSRRAGANYADGDSEELQFLLAERAESVTAREQSAFDDAAGGPNRPLVLFGAGGLGRRTLNGLRRLGIEPAAFADNNPALWGTSVGGIDVLSPEDAARRFAMSAVFVVTIWRAGGRHRLEQFRRQLNALGCPSVAHVGLLYWKYPREFLPYYAMDLPHRVLADKCAVLECAQLWADDSSRREYVAQVRWRLLLDFDRLPSPTSGEQYFPDDLFEWRDDEVFVDCGAFDGDTLRSIVGRQGSRFREIIALEPDPENFANLVKQRAALAYEIERKVALLELAAADKDGTVVFDATGTAGSAIAGPTAGDSSIGAAGIPIRCARLDDAISGIAPTYIKMDIEGAEPEALEGARGLIRLHRPLLAVCVYHRQDHLWKIPRWLAAEAQHYRFFLRSHNEEGFDLVCYAVPEERLVANGRASSAR